MKQLICGVAFLLGIGILTANGQESSVKPMKTATIDILGHRGCRGLMPENTIAAMYAAIDLGTPTLELDCVISQDNKVVVSHDLFMASAFMLKPNGDTIPKTEEKKLLLYKMPYDSIKKYDAGTKINPLFLQQRKIPAYKPLLSDLIDSVEAYICTRHLKPITYSIEIKSRLKGDGIEHPAPADFAGLLMEVIKAKNIQNRVNIQARDIRMLQWLHQQYPAVASSFLVSGADSFETEISKLGFSPVYISLPNAKLDKVFVDAAHAANVKVIVGVPNTADDLRKAAAFQVDGVITDFPDLAISTYTNN